MHTVWLMKNATKWNAILFNQSTVDGINVERKQWQTLVWQPNRCEVWCIFLSASPYKLIKRNTNTHIHAQFASHIIRVALPCYVHVCMRNSPLSPIRRSHLIIEFQASNNFLLNSVQTKRNHQILIVVFCSSIYGMKCDDVSLSLFLLISILYFAYFFANLIKSAQFECCISLTWNIFAPLFALLTVRARNVLLSTFSRVRWAYFNEQLVLL